MKILSFITIGFIFCVLQFLISNKVKKTWVKWVPIGITVVGLLFCLVTYLSALWTLSPSVIAENQYFALFLAVPFSTGFLGCLFSIFITKLLNKK